MFRKTSPYRTLFNKEFEIKVIFLRKVKVWISFILKAR